MKKILLFAFLSILGFSASGNHITGGEMFYVYQGQNSGGHSYQVTLKLYRDCFSTGANLDPSAAIAVFSNANNSMVWSGSIPQSNYVKLQLTSPSPCISNPPTVCYEVGYYTFTVTLPSSALGYTITYQRCCRIAGINNLINSSSVGSTYSAQVPGNNFLSLAPENNSARFTGIDTVIVCANNYFCYDFSATDTDGDSLVYFFTTAFAGGTSGSPAPNPPLGPPFTAVNYQSPYSANSPLGNQVTINSATGMVCGTAPPAGIYVVTVGVREYRNGILIATQRKDLQIKVGDCNIAAAALKPEYISCDGFSYTFFNEAPASPMITSYNWYFGDGNESTLASPTHTYADTGVYIIKLVINKGGQCSDSATSIIKVFPGFYPGFTYSGVCMLNPTNFTDTSKTAYGFIDSWKWDFGDPTTSNDVSTAQHPSYTYGQPGVKNVRFIVTSSKGCIDTVYKSITIFDKPPMSVPTRDTLICRGDFLQLNAIGNGVFSWTPLTNITGANTGTPVVNPDITTTYHVQLNDNGCVNTDSVRVRVVDFVTLQAMPDTTICSGDSLRLYANTDGLQFEWSPSESIDNPASLTPNALPLTTTTYTIKSIIGGCSETDDVKVTLVPYPGASAGPDTSICYNGAVMLNASINGSSFTWTPNATLSNPNILNPVARPKFTTSYILTVWDNIGCPKPGRDTVTVTVTPQVQAFAGNDTAVIVGQPLQFNASGGTDYVWFPPIGLSNPSINNPVGYYNGSFDSIRYWVVVTDEFGCVDSATMLVKVFKTGPEIFIPSAFTPNGDGRNDIFRPIAVGIDRLDYFRVFNRWGELVFSTTVNGHGWDGRINGVSQASGTYVWIVSGTDYTGKKVVAKGTVTLIR